jgi:hypothetical protein
MKPETRMGRPMPEVSRMIQNNPSAHPERGRTHRLWIWARRALFVLAIGLALAVLNNNYSPRHTSRQAFELRMDRAIDNASNWMAANTEAFVHNSAMMFMVADMERRSGDHRLQAILDDYRKNPYLVNPFQPLDRVWRRVVDPHAPVPRILLDDSGGRVPEVSWDAYAMAPDRVELSEADRANMFSPTKYWWGSRHHQLLALEIYRDFGGDADGLGGTINHLAEKIASEAHWDFRVTDTYIQRSAFILGANRPDLVRRRWIERILDQQHSDGSWSGCWYGWCSEWLLQFDLSKNERRSGHATVQAAWTLYMLKYGYPAWIEAHYPLQ